MLTEIRKAITVKLLHWALHICPDGEFKTKLGFFILANIMKL